MIVQPKKSPPTVTAKGERLETLIEGVMIHQQVTQQDERGTLTEIYSPFWEFDSIPLVYLYSVTVNPGITKGWAVHQEQIDRYFFYHGSAKLVLYDDRPQSSTYGMINELYFSEVNRSLVLVPAHIYHAVQNVGKTDVIMINLPSSPYCHHDPDKHTLPLDNDFIPYKFERIIGY